MSARANASFHPKPSIHSPKSNPSTPIPEALPSTPNLLTRNPKMSSENPRPDALTHSDLRHLASLRLAPSAAWLTAASNVVINGFEVSRSKVTNIRSTTLCLDFEICGLLRRVRIGRSGVKFGSEDFKAWGSCVALVQHGHMYCRSCSCDIAESSNIEKGTLNCSRTSNSSS